MTEQEITPQDAYDVEVMDNVPGLMSLMKSVNERREKPECGVSWWLHVGKDATETLVVGVRGDRGSLSWGEQAQSFVPKDGLNENEVDYFTAIGGHHDTQSAGSEVPIELMFKAVAEFMSTKVRPTCVEWVPDGP